MAELDWLGVIRHGESTGNVAAEAAEATGAEVIDIPERDADVPLSDTGREQAAAVGRWLADLPAERRPQLIVVSPYLRARQTAALTVHNLAEQGVGIPAVADERLRDRELGIIDLLTHRGVQARLPGEAARRRRLGKFYYRPPGGEAWTDVLLRLRSLLRDLRRAHDGGRVLLIGHDAIVMLLRYLVEGLTEAELMTISRATTIANCSITSWRRAGGELVPELFNFVDHLHREGARPTRQENVGVQTG
ncbi:MAG TPA: histidine phosphatase family protein [Asanoa sp.]